MATKLLRLVNDKKKSEPDISSECVLMVLPVEITKCSFLLQRYYIYFNGQGLLQHSHISWKF